ncbi:LptE family protein [Fulvivirga sedimenti]|uniref:LPS assembly lipoprotein LptE n=1 Tax=Fulvivirga sedimenti TaxID=2879465 RepID=A0A9X1KWL6_9BACT|nr:LptE family protein [Fulvivirga sedimenti]MCA6073352.1 LPS assembly lipoprotein LptE [Fulvivirga sedimenti]
MSLRICSLSLLLAAMFYIAGCGVYSFTGVSIDAETLSIRDFINEADNGPPDLAQTFSNKIKDYYQRNTNLTLIPEGGELLLEGVITGYRLTPVSPQAGNQNEFGDLSALTRLTITVQVSYINENNDQFNFENKNFSFFSDFDSDENLTAIENQLIEEIYDQIILDIFNASVANW